MKQALHIFVKDVRRFYPEILASLAITLAFVKIYPQTWGAPVDIELYNWVPTALLVLVLLSWLVLIARVMHAESLIGDKQFWMTRPYRWGPLLSAKLLFVFTFVVLPFFVAQCVLLREAKFYPLAHMPGVLFNTAMAIGIVVLPLMLLASITKSFPKMLLGLLFIAMFGLAVGFTSDLLPASASLSDESWWWSFIVPVGVVVALLTCQYATRRTLVIRMLVVAAGLATAGLGLFTYSDGDLEKLYAERQGGGMTGVQIAIQPKSAQGVEEDTDKKKEADLNVPLRVSGIESKTAIKADYARVTIDGPAGEHWESHWQGIYLTWLPGAPDALVHLKINRKFYERMKAVPVTLKLSLALTKLQAVRETPVILREGEFTTPGGSICISNASGWRGLSCRSPLRQPPLMLVAARLSRTACGSAERIPGETAPSMAWIGTLDKDPAEFGITPVWGTSLFFESAFRVADSGMYLCPGAALGFVTYTPVERGQTTMSIQADGLEHFMNRIMMM